MLKAFPTGVFGSVVQSTDEDRLSFTCKSKPSNGALAEMIRLLPEAVMRKASV